MNETIKFAAVGLNHGHIYGQTGLLLRAGAELAAVYAQEEELVGQFTNRFHQAQPAPSYQTILDDESIDLIVTAAIPSHRAAVAIAAMQHGKDVMVDKPGMTTVEQLAEIKRVQRETGRIYSVCYSERFENPATVKAAELVRAGAIGEVVQTIGLGPHRLRNLTRADWFWAESTGGGVICDIASHQFDQFLYFTQSTSAEVVFSQVANFHHPEVPDFQDFGDVQVRGDNCTGYIRVDWFTPDGLPTWGDTRLTVIGSEGYVEVRKNVDIAGREGANHLFLVNNDEVQYINCSNVDLPYGRQLLADICDRTETAMSQDHCFLAMELAVTAQAGATRLGYLTG